MNHSNKESFKLILKHGKQRVKVNTTLSSCVDLICRVPQGSVLGPVLFNTFLNDLFFFLNDIQICNFADDTTPFICSQNLAEVVKKLEENTDLVINWFQNNYLKLNTDKCHLLMSGSTYGHFWSQLSKDNIW